MLANSSLHKYPSDIICHLFLSWEIVINPRWYSLTLHFELHWAHIRFSIDLATMMWVGWISVYRRQGTTLQWRHGGRWKTRLRCSWEGKHRILPAHSSSLALLSWPIKHAVVCQEAGALAGRGKLGKESHKDFSTRLACNQLPERASTLILDLFDHRCKIFAYQIQQGTNSAVCNQSK